MTSTTEISAAIAAAFHKLRNDNAPAATFWTRGEVPDAIGYVPIDALTNMRTKAVRNFLHSNGHPVIDNELQQLLFHHAKRKERIKVAVIAFKYLLLREAAVNAEPWTFALDAAVEKLAVEIVVQNKHRLRAEDVT